jgi:beta-glucan synthesis-associated protein KRE6
MWPYSYAACDVGTFLNQTAKDGTPAIAATGSPHGTPLSYLPGPNVQTGRGVPEIDIFETQVDVSVFQGQVSQSFQVAPYNYQYSFLNTSPATTIQDPTITQFNSYKGGVYQQAVSAVSYINPNNYNDAGYAPYGFEWWSNPSNRAEGYVTWFSDGQQTWKATSASVGPDSITQISQRLISEEPMVRSKTSGGFI